MRTPSRAVAALAALLAAAALSAGAVSPAEVGNGGALVGAEANDDHCTPNAVSHARWEFCWQLQPFRAQGLELLAVRYNGTLLMNQMGLPFGMTIYAPPYYKDLLGLGSESEWPGAPPGYGNGPLPIGNDRCPRWLDTRVDVGTNLVCLETSSDQPYDRLVIWSWFDIHNYRWIQGYSMGEDGTLQPKVLLGGTLNHGGQFPNNECRHDGGSNCRTHYHYVYWRFDVDIHNATYDTIQEFASYTGDGTEQNIEGQPVCAADPIDGWCLLDVEAARDRVVSKHTKWRVVDYSVRNFFNHANSLEIIPGGTGGPDQRSKHDIWALRAHGHATELGYEVPAHPGNDDAITAYDNDEDISHPLLGLGDDVVLWYAEKIFHEPRDEESPSMVYHEAGPLMRIRNVLDVNDVEST